jgi:8-oxo-dGTP pyrophosphatase MutT (NUDIX family)
VFARHAASLIVVRPAGDVLRAEVLMGMRGSTHRFMPNCLVFPGGKVDREDYGAAVAEELRPEVTRLMRRAAAPNLARALAVAAARELAEETGLSLGERPALDAFDYLCRAITPRVSPIRFNARFFVVAADRVSGTLAGSGELEALGFVALGDALALELALVTRKVIAQLQLFLALDAAARSARRTTKVLRERDWEAE